MSLETRIQALAQGIGNDIRALRDADGNLASLNTTAQNNLVAAINEVKGIADSAGGGDVSTADLTTAINNLRTELRGGAGAALDTFAELEAALSADASFAATMATSLGLKQNSVDIGDTDRNFLADYTTARDS